jgi:hypothetical protein
MCEHNLVVGSHYILKGGYTVCGQCSNPYSAKDLEAIYLGDKDRNIHRFKLVKMDICPLCGFGTDRMDFVCGDGNTPIDVTQEFLSLPVRSER